MERSGNILCRNFVVGGDFLPRIFAKFDAVSRDLLCINQALEVACPRVFCSRAIRFVFSSAVFRCVNMYGSFTEDGRCTDTFPQLWWETGSILRRSLVCNIGVNVISLFCFFCLVYLNESASLLT